MSTEKLSVTSMFAQLKLRATNPHKARREIVNEQGMVVMVHAYHGDDGLRCLSGIFIPDNLYDRNLEGHSIGYVEQRGCLPNIHSALMPILVRAQHIHDHCDTWRWMEEIVLMEQQWLDRLEPVENDDSNPS
jgi:hypothetical protein